MESEPIYELLEPGDVLILYKEDNAYICATNKDGDLCIERALVPPMQVRRVKEFTAGEDIELADLVVVGVDGLVRKAKPVVSGSYVFNSKEADKVASQIVKDLADKSNIKEGEYNGDPREFSDYMDYVQRKRDKAKKPVDTSLKAGFDDHGNPIVTCSPDKESQGKLNEWVDKCNDLKDKCWDCKKESDTWPGYLMVGLHRE